MRQFSVDFFFVAKPACDCLTLQVIGPPFVLLHAPPLLPGSRPKQENEEKLFLIIIGSTRLKMHVTCLKIAGSNLQHFIKGNPGDRARCNLRMLHATRVPRTPHSTAPDATLNILILLLQETNPQFLPPNSSLQGLARLRLRHYSCAAGDLRPYYCGGGHLRPFLYFPRRLAVDLHLGGSGRPTGFSPTASSTPWPRPQGPAGVKPGRRFCVSTHGQRPL